jgi:ribonuclease D
MKSLKPSVMISTQRELEVLIERARSTDCVGLDTEFIWERTYFPKLGLIQLALSNEHCYLLDPTTLPDLSPLGNLLSDSGVVKILHDAPQDLMILSRATGAVPQNIFDTRLAAGFSGLTSTISLSDLISVLLDIDLPKTQTRTDWLKRPLDAEQIDYALDDVRYLRALRVLLLTRVVEPEVKCWLAEEMERIGRPESFNNIEDRLRYTKIKGGGSLDRYSLAVLRELAAWREQEARHRDRPRGHVLDDKTLVALSRRQPSSVNEMEETGILSAKKMRLYSGQVLHCITTGLAADAGTLPPPQRPIRLNVSEKQLYERFTRYLETTCMRLGIDPHIVGTSSQFKRLVKGLRGDRSAVPKQLNSGWRKILLDEFVSLHRRNSAQR